MEHVKIYESKEKNTEPILDVEEIFLGFDLWTIITGNMEIKDIKLKDGRLNLIQHEDGEFNIARALATQVKDVDPEEEKFIGSIKSMVSAVIDGDVPGKAGYKRPKLKGPMRGGFILVVV